MRKAIISVDLDELYCYYAIHSIKTVEEKRIIPVAMERFLELFDRTGVKGIFFTVGSDLADQATLEILMEAARRGHEIGCHTFSHHYDLIKRGAGEIREEIFRGKSSIEERLGVKCTWFRAPGYNVSGVVLDAAVEAGFSFDSSILPSPFYYAARAAVIACMKISRRESRSIVGNLSHAFAGRMPGRISTARGEIEEFPISVFGAAGIPVIGTTLAAAPEWLFNRMMKRVAGRDYLNVEFHAIDLACAETDNLDNRLLVEPALKKPLDARIQRFSEFLKIATKN
ncbi:MAG: polysaccharide deacetylase family protein [Deltaproteobacteria bacterium]|nr:polysaccharide deacetylase family protein [Deltaproteobacteria bacterium]